jgi:chromosome transmission fidelity protein 18
MTLSHPAFLLFYLQLKELLAHSAAVEEMRVRDMQATGEKDNPAKNFLGIDTISSERPKPSETIAQETSDKTSVTPSPKRESSDSTTVVPPPKRAKVSVASNFLGIGAAKAKAARNARKAALVGFNKSKKAKVSNTGSDIPMNRVCKFKYQKGFTQAVRTPCRMQDLV